MKLEHFKLAIIGFMNQGGEPDWARRLHIVSQALGGQVAIKIAASHREAVLDDMIDRATRPAPTVESLIGESK